MRLFFCVFCLGCGVQAEAELAEALYLEEARQAAEAAAKVCSCILFLCMAFGN